MECNGVTVLTIYGADFNLVGAKATTYGFVARLTLAFGV